MLPHRFLYPAVVPVSGRSLFDHGTTAAADIPSFRQPCILIISSLIVTKTHGPISRQDYKI
jgi:hypothetical protein